MFNVQLTKKCVICGELIKFDAIADRDYKIHIDNYVFVCEKCKRAVMKIREMVEKDGKDDENKQQ